MAGAISTSSFDAEAPDSQNYRINSAQRLSRNDACCYRFWLRKWTWGAFICLCIVGLIVGLVLPYRFDSQINGNRETAPEICPYTMTVTDWKQYGRMSVCSGINNKNVDIINSDGPFPEVKRAFLAIHGAGYDPVTHQDNLREAAKLAGMEKETATIVPLYMGVQQLEVRAKRLTASRTAPWLVFSTSNYVGYPAGSTALGNGTLTPSSFQVYELLLLELVNCTKFPNLRYITVTGHSKGSYFIDRFVSYSSVFEALRKNSWYTVQQATGGNTYFTYFNGLRRIANSGPVWRFEVPSENCANYNRWPLGTDSLWGVMKSDSNQTIVQRHTQLVTTYFVGEKDNDPKYNGVGNTICSTELQGDSRLQKQQIYEAWYRTSFGDDLFKQGNLTFIVNKGWGHDYRQITTSAMLQVLFNNSNLAGREATDYCGVMQTSADGRPLGLSLQDLNGLYVYKGVLKLPSGDSRVAPPPPSDTYRPAESFKW